MSDSLFVDLGHGLFPRQRHSKRRIAPPRSAASATVMLQRTPPHNTTARVDFDYSTSPRNLSFVVFKRRREPTLQKSNLAPALQPTFGARG
jgi:hypothetical protein